jgi:S-adenosylmethionine:tRNA ribosyltransferase-isomerase
MRTSDFDYVLPKGLIGQSPVEPRDNSRLMVINRALGSVKHDYFYGLPFYLRKGDLLVLNDSRVMPARLYGFSTSGSQIELLLVRRCGVGLWEVLAKPSRRLRLGTSFFVGPAVDGMNGALLKGEVLGVRAGGVRLVQFDQEELLERLGKIPLPPYIHRILPDSQRYQTVYARVTGSVAAPTAGLHFTERLLAELRNIGVRFAFVTLHIGLDTFRPVYEEIPLDHRVHTEYWELSEEAAGELNLARKEGRRIVAIGTTSVRLLEQVALEIHRRSESRVYSGSGYTDLFILPGHEFRMVDALVTNFHLPRSTLLMLVSAFTGRERILAAYQDAVTIGYSFYSFGDAMLIL